MTPAQASALEALRTWYLAEQAGTVTEELADLMEAAHRLWGREPHRPSSTNAPSAFCVALRFRIRSIGAHLEARGAVTEGDSRPGIYHATTMEGSHASDCVTIRDGAPPRRGRAAPAGDSPDSPGRLPGHGPATNDPRPGEVGRTQLRRGTAPRRPAPGRRADSPPHAHPDARRTPRRPEEVALSFQVRTSFVRGIDTVQKNGYTAVIQTERARPQQRPALVSQGELTSMTNHRVYPTDSPEARRAARALVRALAAPKPVSVILARSTDGAVLCECGGSCESGCMGHTVRDGHCDCTAAQYGRDCKHARAARQAVAA